MADCEPIAPASTPIEQHTKLRRAELVIDALRGVPDDTPALTEALALRKVGWRLVVVYCRISSDRHKRDGHGVADQAKHCARIAAQHRLIVVHRYIDNDKSASKIGVNRPEFDSMLAAFKHGHTSAGYPVDGVVCVSDDRLYRDVRTYQRFLACFTVHPSRVYADGLGLHDMYGEEAAQRGLLGAAAARAESAKQQHRAKLNHRARAERGEPVASRRPFGWNADKVTLHAGEAEVVRRGVQSLLHGKTLTAVTQLFVDSGYPSTLGNPWQRQTVKQLLRNPRLCGYRKLDGVLVRGSNGEPVLGLWEPIVSPDEWHAVSEMLERQRHPGGWARSGACPPDGTRYLLTGLVRCGRPLTGRQCGALMHGHPTRTSYEYRCRGALDGGCGRVSRQGPAVDVLITEYALARLDQQGTRSARSTIPWPGSRQLEISRQSKAALQQRWYAGEMTDAEYFSHLTEEESRIKRLVNEQQTWLIKHQPSASDAIEARAYWTGLSMSAQREVLIGLLESVLILPGTKGSHRFEPTAIVPVWRSTRPDTQPT